MKKKDLEKRLSIIEEKLGIVNKELEVGKWYKLLENGSIAFLGGKDTFTYGISMNEGHTWIGYSTSIEKPSGWVEATKEEVKEALVKEAKRRGLVEGCVINDSNICGFEVYDYKIDNFVGYVMDPVVSQLSIEQKKDGVESLRTIFKDGVWVEVRVGEPFFKPEEELKVNDVCKFWNYDERYFEIAKLVRIYGEKESYRYASAASSWRNAKTLTKQEAIKLLFGDD